MDCAGGCGDAACVVSSRVQRPEDVHRRQTFLLSYFHAAALACQHPKAKTLKNPDFRLAETLRGPALLARSFEEQLKRFEGPLPGSFVASQAADVPLSPDGPAPEPVAEGHEAEEGGGAAQPEEPSRKRQKQKMEDPEEAARHGTLVSSVPIDDAVFCANRICDGAHCL